MKKSALLRLAPVALACTLLLTGCSSNIAEHTNTYFTQMKNVVSTALNSSKLIAAAESAAAEKTSTVKENALATPTNFVVNEDGSYSFDAVENAVYYYLYVYENSVTVDASTSLKIEDDGSASYSGNLSELGNFSYATWNIRVVAYPDYEEGTYSASAEAKCDYVVTGAVEYGEPSFSSMWTLTSGELQIKVGDMEYGMTAFPTSIVLTLTNQADASDVVTIEIDDISDTEVTGSTTEVQADATYDIVAEFTWDEEYVSNPSFTTAGGSASTSSTENLVTGEFYYSSSIFNSFDFPHVQLSFNLEEGGLAGVWYKDPSSSSGGWNPWGAVEEDEDADKNCYFYATPIAAESGALYSYDIEVTCPDSSITATPKAAPGSGTTDHIFGVLNIYADGTFSIEIEYQYISTDMMNAAVYYVPGVICYGVYTTNSDGTVNLSYDHENATETDYAIVTELTGKAAAYAEEHADDEVEETATEEFFFEWAEETAEGEEAAEGETTEEVPPAE